MSPSVFLDRTAPPTDRSLDAALGKAAESWKQLLADLAEALGPLSAEWKHSGKTHGWILRLQVKKRTVLYLVPGSGTFTASFALGEKACLVAEASGLPQPVRDAVRDAPEYPEGRAVRLEVRTKRDLATVKRLAAIKMEN